MTRSVRRCWSGLREAAVAGLLWLALPFAAATDLRGDPTSLPQIVSRLQERIDQLERRLAEIDSVRAQRSSAMSAMPARPPAAGPSADGMRSPSDTATRKSADASAGPSAEASSTGTSTAVNTSSDTAADMTRALERALVREGGLLLPPMALEIEPRWSYQHQSASGLAVLNIDGAPQLAQATRRRDIQQAALGLRIGLPARLQLDLLLPYVQQRDWHTATDVASSTASLSGAGAVELGLAWQIWPAVAGTGAIAALRWIEPPSSLFDRDAILSGTSGFRALQASLLFVTRRDPVVFFGALSHTDRRPRRLAGRAVDPGDATGLRAGAIIALSPDTSLRMWLDLLHAGSARMDGVLARGSGGVSGEFSTGFSFVLSPRMLLGIEAAIGLTPSSPDIRLRLSLPIRF